MRMPARVRSLQRRFEARVAAKLLASPAPVLARLAGPPIVRDGFALDPQAQLVLRLLRLAGREDGTHRDLAGQRAELEASATSMPSVAPQLADVYDTTFPGPGGPVRVRVYRPVGFPSPGPALVFFHGGGWSLGSLESHDGPCRVFAAEARCVVFSVDYRRAPEGTFPAGVDDARAAFRWAVANAATWSVDPSRIAVGGDSAGGNLAAVVAHDAKNDETPPRFQLLIYPSVDLTISFPSTHSLGRGFFLERPMMERHVATYLGPADPLDPRASPYFAASFAGLCPAMVVTAGFDPLRDEGDAYAAKLAEAGVPVVHRCYGPLFHGFLNAGGGIRAAHAALLDMAHALAVGLETPRKRA